MSLINLKEKKKSFVHFIRMIPLNKIFPSSITKFITSGTLKLCLLLGIMLVIISQQKLLSISAGFILKFTWALRLMRWLFILSFILSWPYIVNSLGRKLNAKEEEIIYWKEQVYRIAVWFILFDLLICENVLSKAIHYF